jgi:nickel/cobalt exporter
MMRAIAALPSIRLLSGSRGTSSGNTSPHWPRLGRSGLKRNRRVLLGLVLIGAFSLVVATGDAEAHPLGNFSVNHLSTVAVSSDRVEVHYILDQAEIPTLQERDLSRSELIERKLGEVESRLTLRVDGRRVPLVVTGAPRLSFPDGAGGLRTTRLELPLRAEVEAPRRVELRDSTFPGRVGWKAVVAAPGEGTAVRSSAPSGDPTNGLRRYPLDLRSSPLDRREASLTVKPGGGTLVAPEAEGGEFSESRSSTDGFAGLFADAASGEGVLLLLLLTALGWGALHAVSPGHGKAMVAAYLVGTRGTAKHALALGATVTVTHTIGVFALGVVTLALSQYVLPEDLYPWLTLVSGLLVVVIGAGVLRARVRRARAAREMHSREHRSHTHTHEHHSGEHHGHSHAGRPHSHGPEDLSWKGLLGMGTAAGLIPCPSALVVLLAAISQHEVALGLLLITAFSLGLAGTLTVLGLVVVHARKLIPPHLAAGRLAAVLPAASALLIVGVGFVLTAKALPGVV